MNHEGWGGQRTGAGQKPKTVRSAAWTEPEGVAAEPPEDLPADQHDFWRRNAPLAIDNGTLRKQTEQAFRELCEQHAEKVAALAQIRQEGRTFLKVTVDGAGQEHQEPKAHALTQYYTKLCTLVKGGLKDFSLSAFGKPVSAAPKKPKPNPWGQLAQ